MPLVVELVCYLNSGWRISPLVHKLSTSYLLISVLATSVYFYMLFYIRGLQALLLSFHFYYCKSSFQLSFSSTPYHYVIIVSLLKCILILTNLSPLSYPYQTFFLPHVNNFLINSKISVSHTVPSSLL